MEVKGPNNVPTVVDGSLITTSAVRVAVLSNLLFQDRGDSSTQVMQLMETQMVIAEAPVGVGELPCLQSIQK